MILMAAIFAVVQTASAKPTRSVPHAPVKSLVQPNTKATGLGLPESLPNGTAPRAAAPFQTALAYPGPSAFTQGTASSLATAQVGMPATSAYPPAAPQPAATPASPLQSMMPLLGSLMNGANSKNGGSGSGSSSGGNNNGGSSNSDSAGSGFSGDNGSGGSSTSIGSLRHSGYKLVDDGKGPDGDGLCLCSGKRQNLIQCSRGYCQKLSEILSDEGSCAHKYMLMIERTQPAGIGQFCSNWQSRSDKQGAVLQILAALIHRESSWDPRNMGDHGNSRGFFQITARTDRGYEDCHQLTDSNVFNPDENLKCGSCVALTNLYNHGRPNIEKGTVGLGRYFGTMRTGIHDQIASSTNNYCTGTPNNVEMASRTPANATK